MVICGYSIIYHSVVLVGGNGGDMWVQYNISQCCIGLSEFKIYDLRHIKVHHSVHLTH